MQRSTMHKTYSCGLQALKMYPDGPPEVRLGLAYCLLRNGKFEMAAVAFFWRASFKASFLA